MTTDQMDGLLTPEDILNRNKVVIQCMECNKWTVHTYIPGKPVEHHPCDNCGAEHYDSTSMKSFRTYNPQTDNKRRPKAAKKSEKSKSLN